jgi:hypothetical protein
MMPPHACCDGQYGAHWDTSPGQWFLDEMTQSMVG